MKREERRQIGRPRNYPQVKVGRINSVCTVRGGSVAEWLACWTQALKAPGSNRSRDAVG